MAYTNLKAMAQSALDVQSACNLSGVAQSFAAVVTCRDCHELMETEV